MFELLDAYFIGVTREGFESDLSGKDFILLLESPDKQLRGFTTIQILRGEHEGKPYIALFSGDTITHHSYRNSWEMVRVWGQFMRDLIAENPTTPLYWFLISMGYKTYRFFPLFLRTFYPSQNTGAEHLRSLLDHLARRKFGDGYDATRGVITTYKGATYLRPGVADVTEGRMQDNNVSFFVEKNPGHADGEELACLAELSEENLTPLVLRVLEGKALE